MLETFLILFSFSMIIAWIKDFLESHKADTNRVFMLVLITSLVFFFVAIVFILSKENMMEMLGQL